MAERTWSHRLSNLDTENRVADCSVCGPNVPIKLRSQRSGGKGECMEARRAQARRTGRDRRFREKYGISEADYLRMREQQNGLCAVCEKPSDLLVVDHCHDTGAVRGLLCRACNLSLGYLRDDSFNAVSAAKYLMSVSRK